MLLIEYPKSFIEYRMGSLEKLIKFTIHLYFLLLLVFKDSTVHDDEGTMIKYLAMFFICVETQNSRQFS